MRDVYKLTTLHSSSMFPKIYGNAALYMIYLDSSGSLRRLFSCSCALEGQASAAGGASPSNDDSNV